MIPAPVTPFLPFTFIRSPSCISLTPREPYTLQRPTFPLTLKGRLPSRLGFLDSIIPFSIKDDTTLSLIPLSVVLIFIVLFIGLDVYCLICAVKITEIRHEYQSLLRLYRTNGVFCFFDKILPIQEYLKSPEWQQRRERIKPKFCAGGNGNDLLQLHHRIYPKKGSSWKHSSISPTQSLADSVTHATRL